jgi:anaerobic magnesium-protoporphyrin IX monomethyl ester cyclase
MFHGTYTSDFYRVIRDLLHQRVSLEALNTPARADDYRRGTCKLDRRWQDLVASEWQYRNGGSQAAVR